MSDRSIGYRGAMDASNGYSIQRRFPDGTGRYSVVGYARTAYYAWCSIAWYQRGGCVVRIGLPVVS